VDLISILYRTVTAKTKSGLATDQLATCSSCSYTLRFVDVIDSDKSLRQYRTPAQGVVCKRCRCE